MFVTCPSCGADNQEVGKFCEQCGTKIMGLMSADPASAPADDALNIDQLTPPDGVADNGNGAMAFPVLDAPAPPTSEPAPVSNDSPAPEDEDNAPAVPASAPSDSGGDTTGRVRFVRLENGVQNPAQSFVVPVGSRMLVGRTDPANGVFPDVDITMWSQRVSTPDGPLYTVHRKQCFISRDGEGKLWIVDYKDYVGDTMVSPAGSGQFRTIPALAGDRESNAEGGIRLEIGDRILMGQAEGMLIFVITQE
jgi:hypothetical protein